MFAKLVKGVDYTVHGLKFVKGVELAVPAETYEYLKDNSAFEVRQAEVEAPKGDVVVPPAPPVKDAKGDK